MKSGLNHTIKRAIFAGSFDPPTNAHLWMIQQGALLFDELEVVLGVNPDKKSYFSTDMRLAMLETLIKPYPNVRLSVLGNVFLADYAKDRGYDFLLRGMRSPDDFASEKAMETVNKEIQPMVQTVYILCPTELEAISSSMVRSLIGLAGWEQVVAKYVPEIVQEAMRSSTTNKT